jgi:hypothetical protein
MTFPVVLLAGLAAAAPAPRNVRVDGQRFVLTATNASIVLSGPNIVVKGPPWLPSVSGDSVCADHVDDACSATGTCTSCTTFNAADVAHIKSIGGNAIRLGVVWAGAQPRDEDALDPAFVARLHAVLNLTDQLGLHVTLDNHGDMVGTAGCGNGVPMWFQQKAAADLIGKPLKTSAFWSVLGPAFGWKLDITKLNGYDHCGDNATKWAEFAGDPNYNLLNGCCQSMNAGGNPQQIGFSEISQRTMDYLVEEGEGRTAFARYWGLMAQAVAGHPSAVGCELMNEPMLIIKVRRAGLP